MVTFSALDTVAASRRPSTKIVDRIVECSFERLTIILPGGIIVRRSKEHSTMRSTIFVLGLLLAATVSSAEKVTIQVRGMSCGSCEATVKSALKEIDGVSEAQVSYEQGQAVVTYDSTKTTPEAIARAVELRLPGYKLAVGGGPVPAMESTKACALHGTVSAALIERSQVDPQRLTFYEVGLVCG